MTMSKLHESVIADLSAKLIEYEQKYVHQDLYLDALEKLDELAKSNTWMITTFTAMRGAAGGYCDTMEEAVERVTNLRRDAERWRKFEESGDLMIVDFNRRESGSFKTTKRNAVDNILKGGD